jgi:ATP-binding cassette subfamily B (MDR/TAP) protein 1
MIVGAYALVCATFQTGCFEIVSSRATRSFRRQWFSALLRQDAAFFDVYDIAGLANTIGPSSNKYRRGMGRKFGEGIQFMTTFVGGIGFAFYSSWQVALVILGALPFCSLTALAAVSLNQKKSANAAVGYRKAGSVAYSTVSAIRTVLSLNAIPEMVRLYSEATMEAFKDSIGVLIKMGAANGGMLGTFLILYCILAMFGSFLIYRDVRGSGCDPSGSVDGNQTCPESATDVFGAMLGVAFAAQGLSQVSNFFESFTGARVACRSALNAINRKPGASQIEIYADKKEDLSSTRHGTDGEASSDIELGEDRKRVKAILPEYNIDSSSSNGLKPDNIKGSISFKNAHFFYPTRPGNPVLTGLDLEIEAGKTVAIVGPR